MPITVNKTWIESKMAKDRKGLKALSQVFPPFCLHDRKKENQAGSSFPNIVA